GRRVNLPLRRHAAGALLRCSICARRSTGGGSYRGHPNTPRPPRRHSLSGAANRTKTMSTHPFSHIKDPIARAEAMRAQAMADMIVDGIDGVRRVVKAVARKVADYIEYRRTFAALAAMTDRELDDIGITRGDIPTVARGIDPRPAERRPGDA